MIEQPQLNQNTQSDNGANSNSQEGQNQPKSTKKANKVIQLFRPKDFDESHEFLPAALEIQRTPPSPLGRLIIFVIILFFVLAFIWAWFGKIDIVATATGQIVPAGKSKVIQSFETASIKEILVKDGDKVKQGDLLIQLDTTGTQAEVTSIEKQLNQLKNDQIRIQAVLSNIEANNLLIQTPEQLDLSHQLLLRQEVMRYRQQLDELKALQSSYQAELSSAKAAQTKLNKLLPITQKRLDSSQKLYKRSLISEDQLLQAKEKYIEQTQDLNIEILRVESIKAQLQQVQSQQASLQSQTKQTLLQQLLDSNKQLESLEQEQIKAQQRLALYQIKAPIDGTVQQLATNTIGGVVTPAQELMVIVPKDQKLEVEAMLLNKDIGFVHENQAVEVKIDTFNFTKYGVIHAKVNTISSDAVQNEDLGLVYAMRLNIEKNEVYVDNQQVKLTPGMQITAEVKTGQRRIIEYLLTPLLRYQNESIRER